MRGPVGEIGATGVAGGQGTSSVHILGLVSTTCTPVIVIPALSEIISRRHNYD